jgi:hypothetical protein
MPIASALARRGYDACESALLIVFASELPFENHPHLTLQDFIPGLPELCSRPNFYLTTSIASTSVASNMD